MSVTPWNPSDDTYQFETNTTTDPPPVSRTSLLLKPLTPVSKAAIVVSVLVVVGVIAFLIIYFTVLKHRGPVPGALGPASGSNTFGGILVHDESNMSQPYFTGDTLRLTYIPTPQGYSGLVDWWFSSNSGKTFQQITGSTGNSNFIDYVVPINTFTDQARFKVSERNLIGNFVSTADLTIKPRLTYTSGPGDSHTDDTVYTRSTTTSVISVDPFLLTFTTPSQWTLSTGGSSTGPFPTRLTISSIVANTTSHTLTFSWTASTPQNSIFLSFQTTVLVSRHYPSELSCISPYAVMIEVPPSQPSLTILNDAGATPSVFIPGSEIELKLIFEGTLPTVTWTTNNSDLPNFTPSAPVVTAYTAVYTYTLPSTLFTVTPMTITATGSGLAVSAPSILVQPSFSLKDLSGQTINCFPDGSPTSNIISTKLYFTADIEDWKSATWSLGISASTVITGAVQSVTVDSGQLTLNWSVSWSNVGITTVSQTIPYTVYVTAILSGKTITNNTGSPVTFKGVPWTSAAAPIIAQSSNAFNNFDVLRGPPLNLTSDTSIRWYANLVAPNTYNICEFTPSTNCWYILEPKQGYASLLDSSFEASSSFTVSFSSNNTNMCVNGYGANNTAYPVGVINTDNLYEVFLDGTLNPPIPDCLQYVPANPDTTYPFLFTWPVLTKPS